MRQCQCEHVRVVNLVFIVQCRSTLVKIGCMMKCLLSIAAVLTIVAARPEIYKENEEFQYARSSTDEGSKTGFYDAQRGNMGGNYERAHNMDGLAQHQMNTAVKQVDGELGEASKLNSGNVFTSAHSGGLFGSGNYDVSQLHGRNFQESSGYGSSASHSQSLTSQSMHSLHDSEYNSGLAHTAGYRGYQGTKNFGNSLQSDHMRAADNTNDGSYVYGTNGAANSQSYGHTSQSGYHSHNAYDSSNTDDHYRSQSQYAANPQSRLIYATPVRIVGRPGSRIAVPVGVKTYNAHSDSTVDQNAINSEAEVLNTADLVTYRPTNTGKRYESSYSYRKQWEKHDVKPEIIALSVPTESPIPTNSELYDGTQTLNNRYHSSGLSTQQSHSSSMNTAHSSNVKSSLASQSHQYAADSLRAASTANSNIYGTHNLDHSDTTNVLEDVNTQPKAYQSSYRYHKSWERQGDPYVIKPVDGTYNAQAAERLTANHGYTSHHGSSNSHQSHQSYSQGGHLEDCDVNGQIRVARSVSNLQGQEQIENLSQQRQTGWDNIEDMEQQTQNGWDRLENLRQTQQSQIQQGDDYGQQIQQKNWDNLQDLGQQQQKHWDNLEDLGQKQQQLSSWNNLEDYQQQQQQKPQENEKYFGQVQEKKGENLEDFGQQVQQNTWDHLEDLTQQTQQNTWDNSENTAQTQRHASQSELDAWPRYVSASNNNNGETNTFEIMQKPISSDDKQQHSYSKHQSEDEMQWTGLSSWNQKHQTSSQNQENTEQQENKPWGAWESDQHKHINQQQVVNSTKHLGFTYNQDDFANYHHQQNQQSDNIDYGIYDWSQASADKPKNNSFLGSLWDKISEIHSESSTNVHEIETEYQHHNTESDFDHHLSLYEDSHHKNNKTHDLNIVNTHPTKSPPSSLVISKTTENAQIEGLSHEDIGRGDIGPEEDFIVTSDSKLYNSEEKMPEGVLKEHKNTSHTSGVNKKVSGDEDQMLYVQKISNEFHNTNSTFTNRGHSSLGQGYYNSGNHFINNQQYQGHQEGQQQIHNTNNYNKMESQTDENFLVQDYKPKYYHKNTTNIQNSKHNFENTTEEKMPELTIDSQGLIPLRKPENQSLLPLDYLGTTQSNKHHQVQSAQSQSAHKNQHTLKVDEVELVQTNQDFEDWQQTQFNLNDNETIWGQSPKEFMQMPEGPVKVETFGVRFKDEQVRTTSEFPLAEHFKRESIESLDDVYKSNYNLPHYNNQQLVQSPEPSLNIQDTQAQQKNANLEIPVDPTTARPGFWKNAKNKIVSWFKSS